MNCSRLVMLTDATHLIFTSKGRSRPCVSAHISQPVVQHASCISVQPEQGGLHVGRSARAPHPLP